MGVGLSAGPVSGQETPPRKLVAPVRGDAKVEITAPDTRVVGNDVVTTIRVKNISNGPIAGFKIEENWFTGHTTAVGGDTYRHPRPLPAGEVIEITLTTPRKPGRSGDNQYQFSHANGTIKTTVVAKLELPKPVK